MTQSTVKSVAEPRTALADKMEKNRAAREAHDEAVEEFYLRRDMGLEDDGRSEDDQFRAGAGGVYSEEEANGALESLKESFGYLKVNMDALTARLQGAKNNGCFNRVCAAAGVKIDREVHSVMELYPHEVNALASKKAYKVAFSAYGRKDERNHLDLIDAETQNAHCVMTVHTEKNAQKIFVVTTMQHFFNKSNEWSTHDFYADGGDQDDVDDLAGDQAGDDDEVDDGTTAVPPREESRSRFGQDNPNSTWTPGAHYTRSNAPTSQQTRPTVQSNGSGDARVTPLSAGKGSQQPEVERAESVVAESVYGGGSNLYGGVKRSKKRVFAAVRTGIPGLVSKGYRASAAVGFNNFDELYQDTVSREYAQEIIEDLFSHWGVPMDQPEAAKYAEDLLFAFLIATTASNKADYNRIFPIPIKPVGRGEAGITEVDADFAVFSNLLASKYGLTRRQFSRGVADDQRAYLKADDNTHLLPSLANRVGCEMSLAYLAFDGSTHCTGMTTREQTFTRTLESRNLFERDDVMAQGSSDRLMQGMSGGVRSVAPR